jgi:hypothetical protein
MTEPQSPVARNPAQPASITGVQAATEAAACGPELVTVGSKHQQWKMTSSNTPAQHQDDKHDDHNDHYRSKTDVHGLLPPLAPRTALADPGA